MGGRKIHFLEINKNNIFPVTIAKKQAIPKLSSLNDNNHVFCSRICNLNTVQWSQLNSLHLASAEAASLKLEVPLLQWLIHMAGQLMLSVLPQMGLSMG